MKYDLKNYLHLEHEGSSGVGLHCIQHGLCGCIDGANHIAQCPDCNKFLRSSQALRLWLRHRHNDMCRAFEHVLPEWCARGSSLRVVDTLRNPQENCSVDTNAEETLIIGHTVEGSEPMVDWVQCEDCQKWFTLPPGVSGDDLPDVFECGLRWWDCSHHQNYKGDKEWCKDGKIKTKLVAKWLKILEARRAAETAPTIESEDANIQLATASSDLNNGEASNAHLCIPVISDDPLPQEVVGEIASQESQPEGASRTRYKDLSDVCKFTFYLAQWYTGHVARGLVQEARIAHIKQSLFDLDKRGKWVSGLSSSST